VAFILKTEVAIKKEFRKNILGTKKVKLNAPVLQKKREKCFSMTMTMKKLHKKTLKK